MRNPGFKGMGLMPATTKITESDTTLPSGRQKSWA
jgi:hypothetical protein